MPVKDQSTGPNRIPRDYPTVAVVRTKLHLAEFLAVVFALVGVVTLLQSALDEHLMQAYIAGVACLLVAVVCMAIAATLDGHITATAIVARQISDLDGRFADLDNRFRDLDGRFRAAEDRMVDRISRIDRKETRMLHQMTGLQDALGDVVEDELNELDQRRRN